MDPATVMAILEAVVQAWQENEKKNNLAAWQDSVSTKLNQILDNTVEILRDLRRLRVEIEVNMDARFQAYFTAGLRAAISDVGDVLAGVKDGGEPNAQQKERLLNIADNLRNILKQSLAYGFAVLPVALCGYIALLPAMRIGGAAKQEIDATRKSLLNLVFAPALDETRQGSFAWSIKTISAMAAHDEEVLNEALRPATLAMWWNGQLEPTNGKPSGTIPDGTFQAQAAVVEFQSAGLEPASITATEVKIIAVEEPTSLYGNHVSWNNVSPAPAIGIDQRTNSISGARENRQALLSAYIARASSLSLEKAQASELSAFINKVKIIVDLPELQQI